LNRYEVFTHTPCKAFTLFKGIIAAYPRINKKTDHMHEVVQAMLTLNSPDVDLDVMNEMNCSQARERLDEIFSQRRLLEESRPSAKRLLFDHLETCRRCCRLFDVRVRFRPAHRRNIY
jgi:hypothetical protein